MAIEPKPEVKEELLQTSWNPSAREQVNARVSLSFWTTFSTTFITIFLAEMGDKTQLATLLMAAESRSPWLVFGAAACALIATSLVGVWLGWWLSKRISPESMDVAAGGLLLFVSVLLLWDVVH